MDRAIISAAHCTLVLHPSIKFACTALSTYSNSFETFRPEKPGPGYINSGATALGATRPWLRTQSSSPLVWLVMQAGDGYISLRADGWFAVASGELFCLCHKACAVSVVSKHEALLPSAKTNPEDIPHCVPAYCKLKVHVLHTLYYGMQCMHINFYYASWPDNQGGDTHTLFK